MKGKDTKARQTQDKYMILILPDRQGKIKAGQIRDKNKITIGGRQDSSNLSGTTLEGQSKTKIGQQQKCIDRTRATTRQRQNKYNGRDNDTGNGTDICT